ncbi:MAG: ABC transporter substrate-binding protein [Anaerolineae bacterium]|nr:ABC transporter substrate-binding protein [Anaerolineae bacterium]
MITKKWMNLLAVIVLFSLALSACATPEQVIVTQIVEKTVEVEVEKTVEVEVEKTVEVEKVVEKTVEVMVTPEPVVIDRTGAWVDTVVVVEEPSSEQAVTRLEVGELDVYAYAVADPDVAASVEASDALDSYSSLGSYNELTFNTAGPVFDGTGKLNPFGVARIREAMNYLVDRDYIAEEIMGGMGVPRWTCFNSDSNDAALMADVIRGIELKYAYNLEMADTIITEEMEKLGATRVDGIWTYEGEPVEILILIRVEDARREIGDYVGNQLEDIGFTVIRDYRTSAEASPIWVQSDPNEGLFNIYTGGWVSTVVPRSLTDNFAFFYTDMGYGIPLWQIYENDPEFYDLADKLLYNQYSTVAEKVEMLTKALEMAMPESQRIWLVDRASITPKRKEVSVAADLYAGVNGAWLWAQTIQRPGEIGGSMNIAMPSMLVEPWNPIDGTNWVYDMMLIRGTGESALVPDPYTGLWWPNRIERAEVTVQEGLPVFKTLDWVTLDFAPEIVVPDDAWAGWDAETQTFLTASEVYTEPMTAKRKSVVYYPDDLYDAVKWHDGSSFSIADVVMYMIMQFDTAQEASAIYDESVVPGYESWLSGNFRGVRIVSEDPLVIETYSDYYELDAEASVTTWWPYYGQGQSSWHALALGIMAEADGEAAFSAPKAEANEVEWLSYIAGPTVAVLEAKLNAMVGMTATLPYEPTMSQFVTADEMQARFANLAEWYRRRGHFWIGTGPFYMERAFPVEGTVVLQRNRDYPDMATRWMGFAEAPIPEVLVDGPGRVTIGEAAEYEVAVEFAGAPYAVDDIDNVKYLVVDATGNVAFVGAAEAVEDGLWKIVLSAETTGALEAGSNQLEVVVVSKRVAVPATDSLSFVTAK